MHGHLNQKLETDLDVSDEAATRIVCYNDPLHLGIPYDCLEKIVSDPQDGMIKTIFSIGFILFVYMYPIIRGLIYLCMRLVAAYLIKVAKISFFV